MAGNDAFIMEYTRGWRGGLRNLLRAEFGKWFRTRMWLVQTLIWTLVINGVLGSVLWSDLGMEALDAAIFFSLSAGVFPSIAVITIMQDAVVGEKESGTAEWVLSKPLSRSAFVIAKLVANLIGVLVTMVLLPSLGVYIQISIASGEFLDVMNFLGGLGVIYLVQVFYLTLTLMLGTFFNHRGPVIGIPLALAFGQQIIFGILPFLTEVLPWTLVIPYGDIEIPFAAAVIRGETPQSMNPFYAALVSSVLFIALSLWRFEKEEF